MTLACPAAGDNYVAMQISENDVYSDVKKLIKVIRPHWPTEEVFLKTFTNGITNKLVACTLSSEPDPEKTVLVRIYGNKTELLIDRKAELRNIKVLNAHGLSPEVYAVFENGLAYQYYPGETLDLDAVTNPIIWPLVARQLAKMNKVLLGPEVEKEACLWDKIESFLGLLPEPFSDTAKQERFARTYGSVTKLRIEFERLRAHLSSTESPVVFAHNDLLLGNVIYNRDKNVVHFIDYEYAHYNYQAFDIANHFNEFVGISIDDIDYSRYPSEQFQARWIREYLSEWLGAPAAVVPAAAAARLQADVRAMTLASHFMWGVWALLQHEHSTIDFDFGRYAEIRLSKYFELKDDIFKQMS